MITRQEIRNQSRDRLDDWFLNQDSLNIYLSAAATTATVTNSSDNFNEGDILEIEDETLMVTNIDSSVLTLLRGYRGSTAANHTSGTTVNIVKAFTTKEYNDAIKNAFNKLAPWVSERYNKSIKTFGNRFMLDNLETAASWSATADASTPSLDSSDYKQGNGSLNLGATFSSGTAGYTTLRSSQVDATNYEYLNLWVYIKEKESSSGESFYNENQFAEVRIGNHSAAYDYVNVGLNEVDEGWTLLSLNLQDFSQSGTWDKTTTDYMAISFKDSRNISSGDLKMDEWFFSTYPMTTNKLKHRLPKGMFRVGRVKVYESEESNSYYEDREYKYHGNYIEFKDAPAYHRPMEIEGDVAIQAPTSDSDTILLDPVKEELIVLAVINQLHEKELRKKSLFERISSKVNRQDGGTLDVLRGLQVYSAEYNSLLRQFEDPGTSIPMQF